VCRLEAEEELCGMILEEENHDISSYAGELAYMWERFKEIVNRKSTKALVFNNEAGPKWEVYCSLWYDPIIHIQPFVLDGTLYCQYSPRSSSHSSTSNVDWRTAITGPAPDTQSPAHHGRLRGIRALEHPAAA
jgi:hypothetical protein